jgi:tetratricopeptide (TPR) repeat protein
MLFTDRFKIERFLKGSTYISGATSLLFAFTLITGCTSATKRSTSTGAIAVPPSLVNQGQEAIARDPLTLYASSKNISARTGERARLRADQDYSGARFRYRASRGNEGYSAKTVDEVAKQRLLLQKRGPYPLGTKGKNRDPYLDMLNDKAKHHRSYYHKEPEVKPSNLGEALTKPRNKEETQRYHYNPDYQNKPRAKAPITLQTDRLSAISSDGIVTPPKDIDQNDKAAKTKELAKFEVAAKTEDKSVINEQSRVESHVTKPKLPDTEFTDSKVRSRADILVKKEPPKDLAKEEPAPKLKAVKSETPSAECKKALKERELAAQAEDRSTKLFHIRRALRLCPNSAPLHHDLGQLYLSMERNKDAEEEFKQALSIDPNFSASKRSLSAILKEEVKF